MSMHQMEAFIEEAVRVTAHSGLPVGMKRSMICTLFEIESYGDCGFTNLRTINEMVQCQYTSLFDAEEMYDYKEHPEYYKDDDYTGPDGVYYDREQKKYCVDSGSKAWEIMVQNGMITGDAAEPVELMPFVKVFQAVHALMEGMDPYTKDGFHCAVLLSGAFEAMTDEESLEILGKTREDFEDFLENGGEEDQEPEAAHPQAKVYDFWGSPVSFVPDYTIDEESRFVLSGFKSAEGVKVNIFGDELPFSLEIKPFGSSTTIDVFKVMAEMSLSDYGEVLEHIKSNCANYPAFDVLVNNVFAYLQPLREDPGFIPSSILSYKGFRKMDDAVEIKPVSVHAVAKIESLCVTTEIFIKMLAENQFSYDIHYEYKFEVTNERDFEKEKLDSESVIRNINKQQYFYVGVTDSALFGGEIAVSIELGLQDFQYADRCVHALNSLSEERIDQLCAYSVLYCEDFCDAVGAEPPKLETKRDILKHVHSVCLNVEVPEDDSVVLRLSFECDWEEEHGMEWLIKDDKILHVGAYSEEPAYAEESYYHNSWNYANLKS